MGITADRTPADSGAESPAAASALVIVVGSPAFANDLAGRLQTDARRIIHAPTAAEAERYLNERNVVCVLLHCVLPDADGRALYRRLRWNPMAAGIPVLVIGPTAGDTVSDEQRLQSSDGYMESGEDRDKIEAWVKARLRRSREVPREGRRDPLTGLLNRAALDEAFREMTERCAPSGEPVAVALVTADAPARTGDDEACQHSVKAIAALGSTLSGSLRVTDVLGRWGTTEFVVLFPGEDLVGARRAVEKVFEKLGQATEPSLPQLRASAGIALAASGQTLEQTLSQAERHLYQARATGGNTVVTSHSHIHRRKDRVLVLLSQKAIAAVLKSLIEKEGLVVTSAETTDEAVHACSDRTRFQLFVVDEMCPPGGGFDAVRQLRSLPRNSGVPMVMVLSTKTEDAVEQARRAGATDYVMRPIEPVGFVSRVRQLLAEASHEHGPETALCHILLVDDDKRSLCLGASALHMGGGFQIFLAMSAEDMLRRLDEEAIDAVMVPARMLAGQPSLGTTLRAMNIPCVLIAEADTAPTPIEVKAHGAKGVIAKPYDAIGLAKEVEKLLGITCDTKASRGPGDHFKTEIERIYVIPNRGGPGPVPH